MPAYCKKIATIQEAQKYLGYYGNSFELLPDGNIVATIDDIPLRLILPSALPYDQDGETFVPGDGLDDLPSDHPIYQQLGAPASCHINLMTVRFEERGDLVYLELVPPDQATHTALIICWLPDAAPSITSLEHPFDGLTPVWRFRMDTNGDFTGNDLWVFAGKPEMFKTELSQLAYDTRRAIDGGQVFQELYEQTLPIYREHMKYLLHPLLIQRGEDVTVDIGNDEIRLVWRQSDPDNPISYPYTLRGVQNLAWDINAYLKMQ